MDCVVQAVRNAVQVFVEKVGIGATLARPLTARLADAREGDAFVVVGIDWLGRNAAEVMTTIRELGERGDRAVFPS